MIRRVYRYVLIFLLAFIFGGGTFAQAQPAVVSSGQCLTMMKMGDCSSFSSVHNAGMPDHQKKPMKPMSHNCIDQTVCISMHMLSAQLANDIYALNYSKNSYSLSNSFSEGLSPQPTVFPPIIA